MSAFWHWFIIVITAVSILACLWLLISQSRGKTGPQTTHTWDDDLTEYNNPLPRWWFNLFIITAVFGAAYLAFYPGLGNLTGRLGWTSKGEMQARLDELTALRQAQFARVANVPVADLAHDAGALSIGRKLFVANCAGCHGTDAKGAIGFPNLTDHDWIYGGTPEQIVTTITNGRGGQMPSFNGALDGGRLDALLALVPYWSDPKLDAHTRAAGMEVFSTTCAACHGADGKGNPVIGAPNLTDDTWLWGGARRQVRETILFGRKNRMPAHANLLTADEIRVVAGYVLSLQDDAAPANPVAGSGAVTASQ